MKHFISIFFALLLLACNPDPVPVAEVLYFKSAPTPLTIGEPTPIQVQLLGGADWNKRTVVMEVSEPGKFETGEQKVEVRAQGDLLIATALLSSDSPSYVQLWAYPESLKASHRIDTTLRFVKPDPDQVLVLTPSTAAIPADGYQTYEIAVEILPDVELGTEQITFTTDLGTFSDGSKTLKMFPGPDPDRTTSAFLKHNIAESATVQVSFKGATKAIQLAFHPVEMTDLFSDLPATSSQLIADDFTTLPISFSLNRPTQADEIVRIECSHGNLRYLGTANSAHEIQGSGTHNLTFRTAQTGTTYFSLTYLNHTYPFTVECQSAPPDDLILRPAIGVYYFKPLNTFEVQAELIRNQGKPSPGYEVNYTPNPNDPHLQIVSQTPAQIVGEKVLSSVNLYYDTPVSDTTQFQLQVTITGTSVNQAINFWIIP